MVEEWVFGGTCLNRGCIPTKMLVHAADIVQTVEHSGRLGIGARVDHVRWLDIRDRVFGRIDPGGARRIRWLLVFAMCMALLLGVMGLVHVAWVDVMLAITYGALSGYGLLQYGYVRDAYPDHVRGRALSLFTMAMFLGIALMQWVSGLAASLAPRLGMEPFTAALLTMSAMLLTGAIAFWKLPRAPTPA